MVELFGYYLPWEYSAGHEKEHLGTRNAASLCDLDYMGEFIIEGPDALAFVQKLATNDYSKKVVGSVQYTAMCDSKGNMVDDGTIWRLGEHKYMVISGAESDFEWIKSNADEFNVTLKNITSEHTTLALQGPKSSHVMRKLTNFDLESIGYYCFVETKVAGVECILARMGYTGEFGYEIHCHPRHGRDVWNKVMTAGADIGIVPCGQAALESLRQEAGYLLVGNDHDPTTNPFEAGIGRVVSFGKGPFNGRSALAAIRKSGVTRTMVWMKLDGPEVAGTGDPIVIDGVPIGQVTS